MKRSLKDYLFMFIYEGLTIGAAWYLIGSFWKGVIFCFVINLLLHRDQATKRYL